MILDFTYYYYYWQRNAHWSDLLCVVLSLQRQRAYWQQFTSILSS